MKRIRKKPAKTADSDARIDLVRGVFLLALFVQLLGVRWTPPSVNEEVVFQAAGGFLRTGVPALSGTPEAAAMAQEVSKARKTGEACELGFIWQDPEGLSVALGHTPPGAMLDSAPANTSSLCRDFISAMISWRSAWLRAWPKLTLRPWAG